MINLLAIAGTTGFLSSSVDAKNKIDFKPSRPTNLHIRVCAMPNPYDCPASPPKSLNGKFLNAVENGNLQEVKRFLKQGANVNTDTVSKNRSFVKLLSSRESYVGDTALCLAARNDDVAILHYLIKQGADVNRLCHKGYVPLHRLYSGSSSFLINEQIHVGFSPLSLAIENGHYSIVKALVSAGANVNNSSYLKSALSKKHYLMSLYLWRNGATYDPYLELSKVWSKFIES